MWKVNLQSTNNCVLFVYFYLFLQIPTLPSRAFAWEVGESKGGIQMYTHNCHTTKQIAFPQTIITHQSGGITDVTSEKQQFNRGFCFSLVGTGPLSIHS